MPQIDGAYREIDLVFGDFLCRLAGRGAERLRPLAQELSRGTGEGHICLHLEDAVPADDLAECVSNLRETGVVGYPGEVSPLILDNEYRLYLYRYWSYERNLADALLALAAGRANELDIARVKDGISRLFPRSSEDEQDLQKIAAAAALWSRFCVISGGPGTGKTTTVVKILALLLEQAGGTRLRIALAAPTGKAAARLRESIRRAKGGLQEATEVCPLIPAEVTTMHRLLGVIPGSNRFRHDAKNPLPYDIVVVDEASMVALPLMAKLVQALPLTGRLLLLGDREQLASVEPGAVLGDICSTGSSPRYSPGFRNYLADVTGCSLEETVTKTVQSPLADSLVVLKKNYRFASGSAIGMLSRAINEGNQLAVLETLRDKGQETVCLRDLPTAEALPSVLESAVLAGYREFLLHKNSAVDALAAFDRFRVLCAVRGGNYGVSALNRAVEDLLAAQRLISPAPAWYCGRPVMVTVNDYALRLFNGDVGITLPDPEQPGTLAVFFPADEGGVRKISPLRLPPHETVFAMTVHKSQGSEFDRVLLVIPPTDSLILTREILYTGITRARKMVEIWCGEELLAAAVTRRIERRSGLRNALWGSS
ncbi:MAG: exodeoxyribonuclease V subunit alpha [Deltaproteobacteria bacterium]|nr:exodeoxyribonuclease V subunit alpha [Deltaproteobacteria bacterium]TLN03491.1 MAG: exodeoxyribonuclease V subunit alpha [bacterium]